MKYDEIHRVMRTDYHNQSKDYDDVILGQVMNIDLDCFKKSMRSLEEKLGEVAQEFNNCVIIASQRMRAIASDIQGIEIKTFKSLNTINIEHLIEERASYLAKCAEQELKQSEALSFDPEEVIRKAKDRALNDPIMHKLERMLANSYLFDVKGAEIRTGGKNND